MTIFGNANCYIGEKRTENDNVTLLGCNQYDEWKWALVFSTIMMFSCRWFVHFSCPRNNNLFVSLFTFLFNMWLLCLYSIYSTNDKWIFFYALFGIGKPSVPYEGAINNNGKSAFVQLYAQWPSSIDENNSYQLLTIVTAFHLYIHTTRFCDKDNMRFPYWKPYFIPYFWLQKRLVCVSRQLKDLYKTLSWPNYVFI